MCAQHTTTYKLYFEETNMESCDVLRALHESGVNFLAAQILEYLDKSSLKSAERVSQLWKTIITQFKLWNKLLLKEITLDSRREKLVNALMAEYSNKFDDSEMGVSSHLASKLCLRIDKEIKYLGDNWASGSFKKLSSDFGPQFRGNTDNNDILDMNDQYVVRAQPDRRVVLRNRWTLEIVKVLELPIVQIRYTGWVPTFRSVKINQNFIVISFNNHSEVCVWNSKTFDLVRVLDGEYGEIEESPEEVNYISNGHALWNDLLFTCHAKLSSSSCVCTLRKLSVDLETEVCTLYKSEIIGPIVNFWDLAIDDNYIVLFYSRKEDFGDVRSLIEVRAALNFDYITSIPFSSDAIYHFHYYNGIAVTAQSGKFIRFWSVQTGLRLANIPHSDALSCIRIISSKYVVTCDTVGKVRIFDFERALDNSNVSRSRLLVSVIDSPQQPFHERSVDAVMQADEFQIVVVLQFDRSSSHAYVYQFLGDVPCEERKKSPKWKSFLKRRNT